MLNTTRSQSLFQQASQSIPGGVNSPVRAFKSVGGDPLFMKSASGAYLYDEDGNRYIDYINSWGPMIMGHGFAPVVNALREQLDLALSFGAPTEMETRMAELIKRMVPGIDLVRMVNSGTEACMSALRLARGYTGRNKVLKFEGCYHGHADPFLVNAGSGLATLNIQAVPGITTETARDTMTAPYNNLDAVQRLVRENPDQIAAIIVEPVAGNMGCIVPAVGYLQGLRDICTEHGILLIFDEVMTGFRLAAGGAQELYGVTADIITFGKIIGGGLPVGAYAGRAEIMGQIAPSGKIYQAGTLSGNPLAMRAGFAMLSTLDQERDVYTRLADKTAQLETGLSEAFRVNDLPVQINRVGSMISVHFSEHPVTDFATAAAANNDTFRKFFHHCLEQGIYLPPSPFETWFVSDAISAADIGITLAAARSFRP